jgi:hypothetical protein
MFERVKYPSAFLVVAMTLGATGCSAETESDSKEPITVATSTPTTTPTTETSSPQTTATSSEPSGYDNFAAMVEPVNAAVESVDNLLQDPETTVDELRRACESAYDATSTALAAVQGNWVADEEIVGDPYDAVNAIAGYASVLSNKSRAYEECAGAQSVAGAREALSHVTTDLAAAEDSVWLVL